MSTYEYNNLFFKCQSTGLYHVFTFDLKDSKQIENRNDAQIKLIKLIMMMYQKIQEKELQQNKKILVFEEDFTYYGETKLMQFGYKQEPFVYGDLIGFTVYRNSITKEEIINIFRESKATLNIDFEFHMADGYYETNNYEEGNEKYFRGYCIDFLSSLHKSHNNDIRKGLSK